MIIHYASHGLLGCDVVGHKRFSGPCCILVA